MMKAIDDYMGIILMVLLILTGILPYISYNAFLVASGTLLLCFTYFLISTWVIKPVREYKKAKQDRINFKNKHS